MSEKKKIYLKTFGCQMNEYDSEKMLLLLSSDYEKIDDVEKADLAIVNTCSVREKGEHKLFGLLGRLRQLKEKNPSLVIGVGGCVAQQEGESIIKRSPSVDFVVGTHNLSLIPSLVKNSINGNRHQVAIDYRDEWDELPDEFDSMPDENTIIPSAFNSSVRALVAIQRGCDKMCTYCVVPTTRGVQVSRDIKEIVKEITLKVRMGAKEVMLLGQTVNSYGIDLSPRVKFSELVKRVADIEGLERIRFTSPHPAEVRDDFIKLYNEIPTLCPHIHLPLQSGSNRILKLMNRNYKKERYLDIVNSLRDVRPDIALSTDIIVGFPTETDEDYNETIEMLKTVKYHIAFSFAYSKRPNTKAIQVFREDQEVFDELKKTRLRNLQLLQDDITLEINNSYIGSKLKVLVESDSKELSSAYGRTEHNVSVEFFRSNTLVNKPLKGSIIEGVVVRATPHGIKLISSEEYSSLSFEQNEFFI